MQLLPDFFITPYFSSITPTVSWKLYWPCPFFSWPKNHFHTNLSTNLPFNFTFNCTILAMQMELVQLWVTKDVGRLYCRSQITAITLSAICVWVQKLDNSYVSIIFDPRITALIPFCENCSACLGFSWPFTHSPLSLSWIYGGIMRTTHVHSEVNFATVGKLSQR